MSNLSSIEFAIMDEVYFPAPFESIVKNTNLERELIKSTLKNLLEKKFVLQMKYNNTLNDFEKILESDLKHLEDYKYVASKQGLLEHNT